MQILFEGTRVKHLCYGFGEVLEADEERTLIGFDVHGFMRFSTRLLNVIVVNGGSGHAWSWAAKNGA